ncbi:MAG: hypothetical protein LBS54_09420 [Dysgonamonadaceae bacterium]|jgi:hypothetical protein|nr:hypothetical protein [Dysgonamonadaceae bacterium]
MITDEPWWVDHSHEGFMEQAGSLIKYLSVEVNCIRMGFINDDKFYDCINKSLIPEFNDFCKIFSELKEKKKPKRREMRDLNIAVRKLVHTYKFIFFAFIKNNEAVTDADRIEMGYPIRSLCVRKPAQIAESAPGVIIKQVDKKYLEVRFFDITKENKRGKPKGQDCAEIRYVIDKKRCDAELMDNRLIATRSPKRIIYSRWWVGKTVRIAVRWRNTRGIYGPWSKIFPVIIT